MLSNGTSLPLPVHAQARGEGSNDQQLSNKIYGGSNSGKSKEKNGRRAEGFQMVGAVNVKE